MRSREIQQYLATVTGRPFSEIDQRTRPLRNLLKIATGPRGTHAPHMGIAEASYHILSMASRRPADAWNVAERLQKCQLVPHPDWPDLTKDLVQERMTAAVMLLLMMTGGMVTAGFDLRSIEFDDAGRFAWVNFDRRSLKNLRFLCCDPDLKAGPDAYERFEKNEIGSRFVIGAHHLRTLGGLILREAPIADETEAA